MGEESNTSSPLRGRLYMPGRGAGVTLSAQYIGGGSDTWAPQRAPGAPYVVVQPRSEHQEADKDGWRQSFTSLH